MKNNKKEHTINLFGKEYKESDLTDDQIMLVNHLADLERKIKQSEFNLVQLKYGKQAFLDALEKNIKNESDK
jgi:hypothetical protein